MSLWWQSPMTLWAVVAGAQGSRGREPAPLQAPGRPRLGSPGQARHSKSLFHMIAEIAGDLLQSCPSLPASLCHGLAPPASFHTSSPRSCPHPAWQSGPCLIPLSAETLSESGRISAAPGLPHLAQLGQGSLIASLSAQVPPCSQGSFPHGGRGLPFPPCSQASPVLPPSVPLFQGFLLHPLFFPWPQGSLIHPPWFQVSPALPHLPHGLGGLQQFLMLMAPLPAASPGKAQPKALGR